MPARRRRGRGGGYPQSTSTIEGLAPSGGGGMFPEASDLGGMTDRNAGPGITINNINTAIAQAAVEQGPGDIGQGPIDVGVGGGGGGHHGGGGGGHHHGGGGGNHHHHH